MRQLEQNILEPQAKPASQLRILATRALTILPLLASNAGCQPLSSKYPDDDGICVGVTYSHPFQVLPFPEFRNPILFEREPTSISLLNSYFQTSRVGVPDFTFGKVQNAEESEPHIDYDDLSDLYEEYCDEGSYEPQNIVTPDTLETVTFFAEGKKSVIPIVRMACQFTISNDSGNEFHANGLFSADHNLIAVLSDSDQMALEHEATHAYLHSKWDGSGVNIYDDTMIRAGNVLTPLELEWTGFSACSPLNIFMANEEASQKVQWVKYEGRKKDPFDWLDSKHRAEFALYMNIMSRIAAKQ